MDISFQDKKLQKFCEDYKQLSRKYGNQQAENIIQRIGELRSAENLYDISKLPQARLHALSQDRDKQFAVDLKHPKRLILLPLVGSAADLKSIVSVSIVEITDYH